MRVCENAALEYSRWLSKLPQPELDLLAGFGVEGDVHAGRTVQHRYHVRKNPGRPNHTQVHLIATELLAGLALAGLTLAPGEMGENISTRDVDLLALSLATRLHLGPEAVIELTGLRTPCNLLDRIRPGLRAAVSPRSPNGRVHPCAGVMAVVLRSGLVRSGDPIRIEAPAGEHRALPLV